MLNQNLFADIKKLLIESHTKEEIQNLSTSELKKLHGKYLAMGTDDAKKEAGEIKKEIESRGEDAGEEKPVVAQQNEELLMILDVLCEVAGFDMMTLMELHANGEMTPDEFQNYLHAGGAGAEDKSTEDPKVAAARIKGAKQTARRIGTKSERKAMRPARVALAREKLAYDIEMGGEIRPVHEPSAAARAKGAPAAKFDQKGFDKVQDSIEKISDKFTSDREQKQIAFDAMKALAPKPKPNSTSSKKSKNKSKNK